MLLLDVVITTNLVNFFLNNIYPLKRPRVTSKNDALYVLLDMYIELLSTTQQQQQQQQQQHHHHHQQQQQ